MQQDMIDSSDSQVYRQGYRWGTRKLDKPDRLPTNSRKRGIMSEKLSLAMPREWLEKY